MKNKTWVKVEAGKHNTESHTEFCRDQKKAGEKKVICESGVTHGNSFFIYHF